MKSYATKLSTSRKISKISGKMSRIKISASMRKLIFGAFSSIYNVIQEDLIKDLD